jgi:hypothetical protein
LKDLNSAETVEVDLNVPPSAPPKSLINFATQIRFLANTHSALQQQMIDISSSQPRRRHDEPVDSDRAPRVAASRIHGLVSTTAKPACSPMRQFILAAREIIKMGPKFVAIKRRARLADVHRG